MSRIVILLVPMDGAGRNIEFALRKVLSSLQVNETAQPQVDKIKSAEAEAWPFWTWFIPNPRP